ncbi:MAG: hypothetical protein HKM97_02910 [Acidimicrobiia bacterium]|nr:hypothetical protein [Acidimicrobiia bacterium]
MLGIRRFRYIGIALALVLTASACGGGEDGADNPTTTTTTTAPSSGADDGGAADTTTTTMEPVSGDSGSTYCERVREAEASNETPLDFSFFGKSPEELEAQFARNLAIFEEWRDIAPPEIEDDAELVFNFYRTFVERGNELQWDLEAMADDETFNSGFDDAALDAASVNLENHSRDVCGVDFGSTADPGPDLLPGGGDDDNPIATALEAFQLPADLFSEEDIQCMRDELGAEFEAKIDADWVPSTDDIALILAAVDECGIALG